VTEEDATFGRAFNKTIVGNNDMDITSGNVQQFKLKFNSQFHKGILYDLRS